METFSNSGFAPNCMVMLDAVSKGFPFGGRVAGRSAATRRKPDILMPPTKLSKVTECEPAYRSNAAASTRSRIVMSCKPAALVLHRRRERHTILPLEGMTAVRRSVFLLTIAATLALSAGLAAAV